MQPGGQRPGMRLYGPLEPWFGKTWKSGEFELVKRHHPLTFEYVLCRSVRFTRAQCQFYQWQRSLRKAYSHVRRNNSLEVQDL